MQGNGIWGPAVLGAFLARTQETQGEVVDGQQYNHTCLSIKHKHNFLRPKSPTYASSHLRATKNGVSTMILWRV